MRISEGSNLRATTKYGPWSTRHSCTWHTYRPVRSMLMCPWTEDDSNATCKASAPPPPLPLHHHTPPHRAHTQLLMMCALICVASVLRPPSGDLHDYFTIVPYSWPCPPPAHCVNYNGKEYDPTVFKVHACARMQMYTMCACVHACAINHT